MQWSLWGVSMAQDLSSIHSIFDIAIVAALWLALTLSTFWAGSLIWLVYKVVFRILFLTQHLALPTPTWIAELRLAFIYL
jgi:hypothetical protein